MKYIAITIAVTAVCAGLLLFAHSIPQQTYVDQSPKPIAQKPEPRQPPRVTEIVFVGDMMFDRYIRAQAETYGYSNILSDVKPLLTKADLVVGNLEGPITASTSVSTYDKTSADHYRFTFAPTVADLLANHNFQLVTIGNNHITNFGSAGVEQTTAHLDTVGIDHFGHPFNEDWRSVAYEKSDQVFGFVSYNQFLDSSASSTISRIQQLQSEVDWVIVYAHWGHEYEVEPTATQQTLAREFVDAGADVVVGAHPHVVQSHEMYRGAPIYYSLGNFVFDQYFSPAVRCGLVLSVSFRSDDTPTVREQFVELLESDGSTRLSSCRENVPAL